MELVRLVRHQQDQLTQLAGQVGFLQAQLQQAHETIKLLQAPSDETAGEGGIIGVEDRPQTMVMAEEVGHLKAELEQSRQRVAEFEAVAAELEREQAPRGRRGRPPALVALLVGRRSRPGRRGYVRATAALPRVSGWGGCAGARAWRSVGG